MQKTGKDSGKLNLGMRCEECLHFRTGPKSPLYEDRCSNLGRKGFSKACSGFNPDFTKLNKKSNGLNTAIQITRIASTLDDSQLRVMVFSLLRQQQLNKLGYTFGQVVYVYLDPTLGLTRQALDAIGNRDLDYAENYYKAYVIGCNKIEGREFELYLASSVEGKPDYYLSVYLGTKVKHRIVYTVNEWSDKKKELLAQDKRVMPKKLRKLLDEVHEWKHVGIEGRTIDEANPEWFDNVHLHKTSEKDRKSKVKFSKRIKGGKKKRTTDYEAVVKGVKARSKLNRKSQGTISVRIGDK